MLSKENDYITEASNTMFELTAEEQIRKACLDREEYYQDLLAYERLLFEVKADNLKKDNIIAKKDNTIAEIKNENDKLKAQIAALEAQFKL